LVLSTVAIAFLGSPEIGSAYVMVVPSPANALPVPTATFSLPLLRIGAGDPHNRPVTSLWVALVWLSIAAIPIAVATWTVRAPSTNAALVRWVAGYGVFLPYVVIIVLMVLVGLALPIACM